MPTSPVIPLRRTLLRDDVYGRIRDAIVDGTLAPGEQLRDAELAQRLGVSRTPVREALLRLQHVGLVHSQPGRSTVVSSVDSRSTRDAQVVVATMHGVAVRDAVGQFTEADLDEMREANRRFAEALHLGDVEAALAADDDLHRVPVRVCGNAAIAAVIEQYTPILRRVERLRFASLSGRTSVRLHTNLIQACAREQREEAASVSFDTWQTLAPLIDSLDD